MITVFVWSIEETHYVRAELTGVNAYLTLAAFTDKQVACNFRDWIRRTIPVDALMEMIQRGGLNLPISESTREWGELIAKRRLHPAADAAYYERINGIKQIGTRS